jgi:hypothetical protein
MEKAFIFYELALRMKEIGFNEPCFAYYENQDKNLVINFNNLPLTEEQKKRPGLYNIDNRNDVLPQWATSAPTFSQAIGWFRKKHKLFGYVMDLEDECFYWGISELFSGETLEDTSEGPYFNLYEEAELECLKKLIELIESK